MNAGAKTLSEQSLRIALRALVFAPSFIYLFAVKHFEGRASGNLHVSSGITRSQGYSHRGSGMGNDLFHVVASFKNSLRT
jgi:hypothetical protein